MGTSRRGRSTITIEERVAKLEVDRDFRTTQLIEINSKLDNLVTLRDKGIGIFWLASIVFGTSIVGTIGAILSWIKS